MACLIQTWKAMAPSQRLARIFCSMTTRITVSKRQTSWYVWRSLVHDFHRCGVYRRVLGLLKIVVVSWLSADSDWIIVKSVIVVDLWLDHTYSGELSVNVPSGQSGPLRCPGNWGATQSTWRRFCERICSLRRADSTRNRNIGQTSTLLSLFVVQDSLAASMSATLCLGV